MNCSHKLIFLSFGTQNCYKVPIISLVQGLDPAKQYPLVSPLNSHQSQQTSFKGGRDAKEKFLDNYKFLLCESYSLLQHLVRKIFLALNLQR